MIVLQAVNFSFVVFIYAYNLSGPWPILKVSSLEYEVRRQNRWLSIDYLFTAHRVYHTAYQSSVSSARKFLETDRIDTRTRQKNQVKQSSIEFFTTNV